MKKRKLKIYLFRHGKTHYNAKGIFSGWKDTKLNKEGIRKNELKQILNLTQTRLDAALKILEKREIIKMTESANPEVFFDERFKEL